MLFTYGSISCDTKNNSIMKSVNALQYKRLAYFCKDVFRHQKFISQRAFNLLIQQQLSQFSTRYRRDMISLGLVVDKNKVLTPGVMLTHFKLKDYQAMNRLQKSGKVDLLDNNVIRYTPNNHEAKQTFPDHWDVLKKRKRTILFSLR